MDKNLCVGVVGVMVVGGLYYVILFGKLMVVVGVGIYKGESVVVVGYFCLLDNGKVGIKFFVNMNICGDVGVVVSVGY